jgi:hypothetical protein
MTEDTIEALQAPSGPLDAAPKEQPSSPQNVRKQESRERNKKFKQSIEATKQYRAKLITNWIASIDYRRGKPFNSQTDEDRVVVNLDWPLTKAKHAALFSQIPQVHVDHAPQTLSMPWVFPFEQRLNDTLITAGIESAMDEVMPDVINAAGFGVVVVAHEAITEDREVPMQDLSMFPTELQEQIKASKMLPDGTPLEMQTVPFVLDRRYTVVRISPSDFLWPLNFTGSDFDNAPWIGYSGGVSWPEAKRMFKLTDEQKAQVVGAEGKKTQDRLTQDVDKDKDTSEGEVRFDQIFYKEYCFDPTAKSYSTIHRLVFIDGLDEPVIDEPWNGQQLDPQTNQVIGALKYPTRVLTLTYITDDAIPPSDSAIGRPQVNEIIKSRTQMILQRERSLPLRWFNVDRIDPTIQQSLMRGTWQGMIPVQGDGARVIGEVARASMPQEDFSFDNIAKQDLNESWQIGPNQQGNFGAGRQSASEANLVESNFQTRIGRERAKVGKFFVSIAEVLGGLMCLFEDPASFGEGFTPEISKTLAYSILADSTVLVDSQQRLARLMKFIDMTAKSGWVDVGPVIKEIATLSGLDPNVVVRPPQPAPPETPNISLRLTGVEDLNNPLTLALLMQSGQAPSPDLIEQAKKLIQLSVTPPAQPPAGPMGAPSGAPVGPQGPMPQAPLDALGITPPAPPVPAIGEANPGMGLMEKINKRSDDGRNG